MEIEFLTQILPIYLFTIMKKEEILSTIRGLARSQGCWWRLLHAWEEEGMTDYALEKLEEMNFKDWLDLILFLEGK